MIEELFSWSARLGSSPASRTARSMMTRYTLSKSNVRPLPSLNGLMPNGITTKHGGAAARDAGGPGASGMAVSSGGDIAGPPGCGVTDPVPPHVAGGDANDPSYSTQNPQSPGRSMAPPSATHAHLPRPRDLPTLSPTCYHQGPEGDHDHPRDRPGAGD